MELVLGVDVFIETQPMPPGIKGFIVEDNHAYYVYINSQLSSESQTQTIEHELNHLANNDFYCEDPLRVIERRNKWNQE